MNITSRELLSNGLYKIKTSDGDSFFMRPEYLRTIAHETFLSVDEYDDEQTEDIVCSGLIAACECKAVEYLSHAEQCRSGLYKKLINKGYSPENINPALDFLESKKYLSDERFARSWLNVRKINHAEGRARLQKELLARGISYEVVENVLDEFFLENDENEIALCAYYRILRKNKSGDKLIAAMLRRGFTYKMVMECMGRGD